MILRKWGSQGSWIGGEAQACSGKKPPTSKKGRKQEQCFAHSRILSDHATYPPPPFLIGFRGPLATPLFYWFHPRYSLPQLISNTLSYAGNAVNYGKTVVPKPIVSYRKKPITVDGRLEYIDRSMIDPCAWYFDCIDLYFVKKWADPMAIVFCSILHRPPFYLLYLLQGQSSWTVKLHLVNIFSTVIIDLYSALTYSIDFFDIWFSWPTVVSFMQV